MTSTSIELLAMVLGCALALAWIVNLARFSAITRNLPGLDPRSHEGAATGAVAPITVVVAAKDEEDNIEPCVRSIMAQDHPAFDLVVVNDRSADRTPAILQRLAHEFAGRMRAITIAALPEGWGGQNHALRQGMLGSAGEWLCFTDADCRWDSPRTLSIAAREAAHGGADLLSILPLMEAPTLWERCYLPICCMVFMLRLRIGEVNRSDRPAAYANGAFMLIRRHVYETLGGHGKVRNELNDDIALGRMAKRDGFQLRLAGNGGLYRTRMYGSVRRAWDGWTRNFCGTLGSTRELLAALAITVALFIVPWAGLVASLIGASSPVSSPSTTSSVLSAAVPIAWGLAVIVSQLGMWAAYPFFGSSAWHSLLFPPGAVFVAAIVARATIRSFRRSGTSWHGAHYGPRPRGQ